MHMLVDTLDLLYITAAKNDWVMVQVCMREVSVS